MDTSTHTLQSDMREKTTTVSFSGTFVSQLPRAARPRPFHTGCSPLGTQSPASQTHVGHCG